MLGHKGKKNKTSKTSQSIEFGSAESFESQETRSLRCGLRSKLSLTFSCLPVISLSLSPRVYHRYQNSPSAEHTTEPRTSLPKSHLKRPLFPFSPEAITPVGPVSFQGGRKATQRGLTGSPPLLYQVTPLGMIYLSVANSSSLIRSVKTFPGFWGSSFVKVLL